MQEKPQQFFQKFKDSRSEIEVLKALFSKVTKSRIPLDINVYYSDFLKVLCQVPNGSAESIALKLCKTGLINDVYATIITTDIMRLKDKNNETTVLKIANVLDKEIIQPHLKLDDLSKKYTEFFQEITSVVFFNNLRSEKEFNKIQKDRLLVIARKIKEFFAGIYDTPGVFPPFAHRRAKIIALDIKSQYKSTELSKKHLQEIICKFIETYFLLSFLGRKRGYLDKLLLSSKINNNEIKILPSFFHSSDKGIDIEKFSKFIFVDHSALKTDLEKLLNDSDFKLLISKNEFLLILNSFKALVKSKNIMENFFALSKNSHSKELLKKLLINVEKNPIYNVYDHPFLLFAYNYLFYAEKKDKDDRIKFNSVFIKDLTDLMEGMFKAIILASAKCIERYPEKLSENFVQTMQDQFPNVNKDLISSLVELGSEESFYSKVKEISLKLAPSLTDSMLSVSTNLKAQQTKNKTKMNYKSEEKSLYMHAMKELENLPNDHNKIFQLLILSLDEGNYEQSQSILESSYDVQYSISKNSPPWLELFSMLLENNRNNDITLRMIFDFFNKKDIKFTSEEVSVWYKKIIQNEKADKDFVYHYIKKPLNHLIRETMPINNNNETSEQDALETPGSPWQKN